MTQHSHLHRLERVWVQYPIFFLTTCTHHRMRILDNVWVATILRDEWTKAKDKYGWSIGRYVIMPDHVHFFCAPIPENSERMGRDNDIQPCVALSTFMQSWKQWTAKRIIRECKSGDAMDARIYSAPIWQAGFFDHVLRSAESYAQKWEYVRDNPVRKGLVTLSDDWQWQGEIVELSYL